MPKSHKIIQSNSSCINLFKKIFWVIFNLFLVLPILFLYIIKPLIKVQFLKIRDDRIGHLTANTELFLRKLEIGIIKKKRTLFVGIASTKPCNKQLLRMYKRKMLIIQLPKVLSEVPFSEKSLLVKSGFGIQLHFKENEYYPISSEKPNLDFASSEEKKGQELLKKMGLTDKDWFICFHARNQKYLAEYFSSRDMSYHNIRDWDINTALKAAEYIASKGGFAIRMGAVVEKRLKTKNPRIIDYASSYRTEFGDIYLPSKCKFFLGDGCGINQVAQIFNVPEAWVNRLPVSAAPWSRKGVYIPKKMWSIKKRRFLTFREIIDLGIIHSWRTEEYANVKVKPINNTPEEILDLVIEVNERINRTWKTGKEDEKLQKKFRSLFPKDSPCYGFPSRIGAKFLRENKNLLS